MVGVCEYVFLNEFDEFWVLLAATVANDGENLLDGRIAETLAQYTRPTMPVAPKRTALKR